MADLIDQEAKRRGVSRETLIAYYNKQRQMTGQNGTGAVSDNERQRVYTTLPQKPQTDQRGALQRLLDALGGNPSGK
jgi:hypothetical protein